MALSKVLGVYRLTADPELKYLPSGSAIAKLKLVNSAKYKSATGEQKEETCFIDGSIFGKMAEIANQYLHKGSKVFIAAELKQETWGKDGRQQSRHALKIDSFEMLDSKNSQGQQTESRAYQEPELTYNGVPMVDVDMEDSIPF